MARTSPTRVDDDLFASAQMVGSLMDRSAAQQITHWARIGREIESASSTSYRAISEALAQQRPYDDLSAEEQAVVRAGWSERMDAMRESLDLAGRFRAEGRSYAEVDEHGQVVVRGPDEPASTP
jgi:ParD-like antitoxin of type II bacterial toxin-antitoxin system